MYASVDRLVEMALGPDKADFSHLCAWNRFYCFCDNDLARLDKKDFLVPTSVTSW